MSGRDAPGEQGRPLRDGSGATLVCEPGRDVIELAAWRGQSHALAARAASQGMDLPALGRVSASGPQLALCVRPERWLLLAPSAGAGLTAARWHRDLAGIGAAIDLSSGLCVLRLGGEGAGIRAALARGCRLDLDPQAFPVGRAAATMIAQVSVILASLADGMLLLTPSTTARHFREWLGANMP